jgi:hypothetical protein
MYLVKVLSDKKAFRNNDLRTKGKHFIFMHRFDEERITM